MRSKSSKWRLRSRRRRIHVRRPTRQHRWHGTMTLTGFFRWRARPPAGLGVPELFGQFAVRNRFAIRNIPQCVQSRC